MNKRRGFTLIEIMVTLAIVVILAVVGGMTISSRVSTSNLENAAATILSDLSAARTEAMLKGCPTRLIFCTDRKCNTRVTGKESSNLYIGSGTAVARYYGFYRMANKDSASPAKPCYNESSNLAAAGDGFDYWDYDRRPQKVPDGVAFSPIYNPGGAGDTSDWYDTASSAAANSIWFDSNTGLLTPSGASSAPPLTSANPASTGVVAVQLTLSTCDPRSTSNDCVGYFITLSPGGEFTMVKCIPGVSGAGTDGCL